MGLFLSPPEINYTTILFINSSTTEVFLGEGGYICPHSEFQMQSFHVLKRRPCHCVGTTLFVIFLTAVACVAGAKRGGKGRGREKSMKVGKGKGAPAIRAGVFVICPPFSQLIR